MKFRMTLLLITIGILFIVAGLVLGFKTMKIADYILLTVIIGVITTIFGALGNRKQTIQSDDDSAQLKRYIAENAIEGNIKFSPGSLDLNRGSTIEVKFGATFRVPPEYIKQNENLPLKVGPLDVPSFYTPLHWYIENNDLKFSCKCVDIDNNIIVELDKNHWRRNPNFTSAFNYDSKGFEVLDNRGNVALSVDLQNNNRMLLQGYFLYPNINYAIILGSQSAYSVYAESCKDQQKMSDYAIRTSVTKLFVYNQMHSLGVRSH